MYVYTRSLHNNSHFLYPHFHHPHPLLLQIDSMHTLNEVH